MKLIGSNSFSNIISYCFLVVSTGFIALFVYFSIVFLLCYFEQNAVKIYLEQILDMVLGENSGNQLLIRLPFGGFEFSSPVEIFYLFVGQSFLFYYIIYFYLLYRIFRLIGSESVFQIETVLWLKRFSFLNFFIPILIVLVSILDGNTPFIKSIINCAPAWILHLLLGAVCFYLLAFFRRANQLQNEVDLTV